MGPESLEPDAASNAPRVFVGSDERREQYLVVYQVRLPSTLPFTHIPLFLCGLVTHAVVQWLDRLHDPRLHRPPEPPLLPGHARIW